MDERNNIEYNMTTKGVNQTAYDFTRVADAASQSGQRIVESTGRGALGAKGMGVAFKSAAHEMGLTGAAARLFGHEVSDLTMMLGAGATGIGLVVVAAVAAYKVYDHFASSTKKLQEEQIKAADAAVSWVDSMRIQTKETDALRKANDRLFESKKKQTAFDLGKGIKAQTDIIIENYEKMTNALWLESAAREEIIGGSLIDRLLYGTKETRQNNYRQAQIDYEASIAKLQKMYEEQGILGGKGGGIDREHAEKAARIKEILESTRKAALEASQAGLKSYQEMWLHGDTLVGRWEAGLVRLQQRTKVYREEEIRNVAAWNAGLDALQAKSFYAEENRIKTLIELNEQRWENYRAIAGNIAQMSDTMASIGGQQARKWFTLAKQAATAEALINTYQGATKALAQGGFWGIAMAATVTALGLANVAKIQSQNFSGGAGVGGGSIGTYSANPVTGLPAQPAPMPQTKVINIYVQGHLLDNDGLMRITADADNRAEADNVYSY